MTSSCPEWTQPAIQMNHEPQGLGAHRNAMVAQRAIERASPRPTNNTRRCFAFHAVHFRHTTGLRFQRFHEL